MLASPTADDEDPHKEPVDDASWVMRGALNGGENGQKTKMAKDLHVPLN
jgi:hypothetical protein